MNVIQIRRLQKHQKKHSLHEKINFKKLTFSWQKLTYLGTEDSDRKTDIKFGFSVSDLHRKHIFSSKKIYKKVHMGWGL